MVKRPLKKKRLKPRALQKDDGVDPKMELQGRRDCAGERRRKANREGPCNYYHLSALGLFLPLRFKRKLKESKHPNRKGCASRPSWGHSNKKRRDAETVLNSGLNQGSGNGEYRHFRGGRIHLQA